MRQLTVDEIKQVTAPEAREYDGSAGGGVWNVAGVARSVELEGERIFIDRESYERVCERLGVDPNTRANR